jgi:hypothetical protein
MQTENYYIQKVSKDSWKNSLNRKIQVVSEKKSNTAPAKKSKPREN